MRSVIGLLSAFLVVITLPCSAAAEVFTFQATDFVSGQLTAEQLNDLSLEIQFGITDLTGGFVGYDSNGEYVLDNSSVTDGTTVLVTTRFKDQILKSFNVTVISGWTRVYNALTGFRVASEHVQDGADRVRLKYEYLDVNIFAVDTAIDLISDQPVLGFLGVSINGGAITNYNQSSPSLSVLNGDKVLLKVYFDDEGTGLDAGDELPHFTAKHSAGIGVSTGSRSFDAKDGNKRTIPSGQEQGTAILIAYDVNEPPVAIIAGEDQVIECIDPVTVLLNGSLSSDPDGDELLYEWTLLRHPEPDTILSTEVQPDVSLPLGINLIRLTVLDPSGEEGTDEVSVTILDTNPPVFTWEDDSTGEVAPTVNLELHTPYVEPVYTAIDACEGVLTASVTSTVDVHTPGTYEVTYEVPDHEGTATATRVVNVVVTANSHVLVAVEGIKIGSKATLHSGDVSIVDFAPVKVRRGRGNDDDDDHDDDDDPDDDHKKKETVELIVGNDALTGPSVTLTAPHVEVKNKATIEGTLVYHELVKKGRRVSIENEVQVSPGYWPLFQDFDFPLPAFETGTPGTESIDVRSRRTVELSPGVYRRVRIRNKGTLILTGGVYDIRDFDAGSKTTILIQDATTLRISGRFSIGSESEFGPEAGATIGASDILVDASDILIFVEGANGKKGKVNDKPAAVDVGQKSTFDGNIYAENGTIRLRQKSRYTGSFIGRWISVDSKSDVYLDSGWDVPGVIYSPPAPPSLTKRALVGHQEETDIQEAAVESGTFGLNQNYPNPFNPSTTIRYSLPNESNVRLVVYNILGQEVRVLIEARQGVSDHAIAWDGRDAFGREVATGMYIYRLIAGENESMRKMIFAK